jgi:hypothetical protein
VHFLLESRKSNPSSEKKPEFDQVTLLSGCKSWTKKGSQARIKCKLDVSDTSVMLVPQSSRDWKDDGFLFYHQERGRG